MRIFPFILVVLFFILAGSVSSPAQNAASVEPLLLYKAQQDKNCRHWVDSVMDKLSFKEKVGQLFIYTIAPVNTKRNLELLREFFISRRFPAGFFLLSVSWLLHVRRPSVPA